jgi:hypothetical protein
MSIPNVMNASFAIPLGAGTAAAAGTSNVVLMALPGTLYGGGITLLKVWYSANKAVAAGSAPSLTILGLSSTGGTATSHSVNGSAALTAGTPITGTIGTAWVPGTVSFLALQYGHETFSAHETVLTANIVYAVGRGSA